MSRDLYILLAMILVGATWLVTHLLCWLAAANSAQLARPLRLLSWLPVLSPLLCWVIGRRLRCLLWFAHLLMYSVLWRLS